MKKLKLSIMGAAKFAFGTSLIGYFLSLFFFVMSCENVKVAGITLPYNRWGIHTHTELWVEVALKYTKYLPSVNVLFPAPQTGNMLECVC